MRPTTHLIKQQRRAQKQAQLVIDAANSQKTRTGRIAYRYLEAWIASGFDLHKIPEIYNELERYIAQWRFKLLQGGERVSDEYVPPYTGDIENSFATLFDGTQQSPLTWRVGGKDLTLSVFPETPVLAPALTVPLETAYQWESGNALPEMTVWEFCRLITGMCARDVDRCTRCGKFFLKVNGHPKQYCSLTCKNQGAVTKIREAEKQAKQERALRAYAALRKLRRPPLDWKRWMAKKANVHLRWLTRTINRGELPNFTPEGSNRAPLE